MHEEAQSAGKTMHSCAALLLRALGTVASNETKGAMDSDNLRIMAVLVDTSIILVHWLSGVGDVFTSLRPVFKWAMRLISQHAQRFCPDDTSTDACALPYYTVAIPGIVSVCCPLAARFSNS